ncbi:hypothetical protein [Borreliella americana]|uniref:hypothetical protein n=1 Tax=Borreliella americana TaxID=478807 RepID=UPI0030803D5E
MIGDFEKPGAEVQPKDEELMQADESQGQFENQIAQGIDEDLKLKKEKIEKKIQELKNKIEKSDKDKKNSLKTYCDYEKEIKKIREELDELKDKLELENQFKELENSLKKKKEERKKELEEAKEKFKEFEEQVKNAGGVSVAEQVKKQGGIGGKALQYAKNLGLSGNNFGNITDSGELAKKVIEETLKNIEEELKNTIEDNGEVKKE